MTKAEEIFEKHLVDYDTTSYTDEDIKLKQCYINAINEALNIPVVSGSVISIDEQAEIIIDVINEMMTTFDGEDDRMDYILDFVKGYKKDYLNINAN